MKIGDTKKAMSLGVVAVFAVGILGKTALASFSSSGPDRPLPVRDLGNPSKEVASPNAGSENASPPSLNLRPEHGQEPPAAITRDAFSKPTVVEKPKRWDNGNSIRNSGSETQSTIPPASVEFSGGIKGATTSTEPDTGPPTTTNSRKITPPKKPMITIRFDGYVEAGSPMGVISIDGKTQSVHVGEEVGSGIKVGEITNEHIIVSKGKLIETILIGKEMKF